MSKDFGRSVKRVLSWSVVNDFKMCFKINFIIFILYFFLTRCLLFDLYLSNFTNLSCSLVYLNLRTI